MRHFSSRRLDGKLSKKLRAKRPHSDCVIIPIPVEVNRSSIREEGKAGVVKMKDGKRGKHCEDMSNDG